MTSPVSSYTLATGWWCDGTGRHAGSADNASSDFTRTQDFFDLWCEHVFRHLNPEKVLVTDSASPIKPRIPPQWEDKIELVSLVRNFGHARHAVQCGWTKSFLNGAYYSLLNESDYYVYLEQDCLFKGDIVTSAIGALQNSGKTYAFGAWQGKYGVEQSLVVIARQAILGFIHAYASLDAPEHKERPETKFFRIKTELLPDGYLELPFGVGRNRPIPYHEPVWYAQHLTDAEIEKAKEMWT